MEDDFTTAVENLIQKAPADWLFSACEALRSFPATATAEFVLQRLPTTNNADLSFLATKAVRQAYAMMSWEALSWTLQTTHATHIRWQADQHIELLWSGPSPANQIPARRIDQALYDLITNAKHEILLVTFAAAKIERLTGELLKAAQRGVRIRLILEFEQSSEGQLSYDALKAFPSALVSAAEVYHWPVEKRERNQAGKPGKLHAKVAVIDNAVLVSSANLTDDAFNRNLELGVMMHNPSLRETIAQYLNALVETRYLACVNADHGKK
jgi:cardiolipin synthase